MIKGSEQKCPEPVFMGCQKVANFIYLKIYRVYRKL